MTDINGNTWPEQWVDTYNNLTRLIEGTYGVELKERYLEERHRLYVLCMHILSEDKL